MAPNPGIEGIHKNAIIISKNKVKKQTDKQKTLSPQFFLSLRSENTNEMKYNIFKRYFILTKT